MLRPKSPSRWRMSVVLPAPLAPTMPKTAPRGTRQAEVIQGQGLPKRRRQPLDLDHGVLLIDGDDHG